MNKKRITFAIVLFVILGLFVYAFANPLDDSEQLLAQTGNGEQKEPQAGNTGNDTDNVNTNINTNNGANTRRRNFVTRNLANTTTQINPAVSLISDIATAINELKNYKSDYVYTDDTKYNQTLEEYIDKINNSTSIEDIVKNLNDGEATIDALIKEDLDAYKEKAKKEIKDYSDSLNIKQDISEILDDYYNQIDEATTKKDIDTIVEEAKKALDALKEKEISDAKENAKEEINNYKADDEEFIEEIKDEKNKINEAIDNAETLEDIDNILDNGKDAIDDIIANKTFTVTFVTKETKIVRTVKYKEAALEPTSKEFKKTIRYKNVNYKFIDQWDTDFSNVTSDLVVNALYRVTHVYAKVYLIADDLEIPEDPATIFPYNKYSFFKEIRVAVSDKLVKSAAQDEYSIIYTNEKDIIRDANKYGELPLSEGKYTTYKYYVMKFCGEDGLHIDGKMYYDFAAELADKKAEAKEYIDGLNKEDEQYLEEITTIKNDGKEDVDNAETLEAIDEIVKQVEQDINDVIANKKFTVTFYGIKGKKLSTKEVGYKKAVTSPTMKEKVSEWNGSIKLKYLGWNVDADALNSVTSDLVVTAQYQVLSATTKISILKENLKNKDGSDKDYSVDINDFNHPYNKPEVEKDIYFTLKITDEIEKAILSYTKDPIFVYVDDDATIREVIEGEPDVYNNNKYKKLQYYVLKLQGDRFHCDARVLYDKATELTDAKEAAINEIKGYKTEDEEFIKEITDTKTDAINAIKDMTSVEEVTAKVPTTKEEIDNIIANKKFTVKFVGFNGATQEVSVGYKKDAVAPTTSEFTAPVRKDIYYSLTGWDKEFKNITSDITVTASYKVTKALAKVYQRTDKNEVPTDKLYDGTLRFKQILKDTEVELELTDELLANIADDKYYLFAGSDEAIRALDKNKVLPKGTDKYHNYVFYGMKFCNDGYHIDGALIYDELADKTDELRKLINEAKEVKTTGKTNASIKELNDAISAAEKAVTDKDLTAIKNSIEALTNPAKYLVDIKVTEVKVKDNKNGYYIQGQDLDLTVTYSNNNGVKDKVTTDYEIVRWHPTHAYVVVDGVRSDDFEFTIVARQIESIKVDSAKYEYFLNEDAQLTVTATYNDGTTETLGSDKYKLTGFVKHKTTYKGSKNHPKTAKVHLIENESIQDTFDYSISTYTKEAWDKERVKRIQVKLDTTNHTLVFTGLDADIEIKDARKEYTIFGIKYDDHVFDLISTDNHSVYSLKDVDYDKIKDTNTVILMQILKMTYVIDGKEYKVNYIEFFDNLY